MAQIKPEGIVQSDPQVKLIEAIVKQAYLDIFQHIQAGKDSQSVKVKIKGLEKIVAEYDLDLQAWADVTVPGLYKEGMDNAIKQAIKDNIVYTFEDKFATFHQQTIQLIVQNAYKYTQKIADGLEEAGTSAITAEQAEKVAIQVARGEIAGSDLKTIAKNVENELRASSLSAITYKNGRNVSVDGYARTLARSILTEAQVTGIQNTHIEEGYDLVQVSDHFGECAICRPWENEVLSLTGRTRGYTTLDKAKEAGLFHSNCRHSISPYFEGLASVSKFWDVESQSYISKADPLVEQAKMMKLEGKTFADFMTVNNIKNYGNINIINVNTVKEEFFIPRFQQGGFLTQKSASGISYFAQDRINALNQALKIFAKVGKANVKDFKGGYSLDKIIDNPLLFEKYPRLKEQNVVFADFHTDKKYGLYYDNTIFINSKLYEKNPIKLTSTIVHEVQHVKQDINKMVSISEEIEKGKIKKAWDSQREIDARRQQQLFVESQESKEKLKKVWDSVQDISKENILKAYEQFTTKIGIQQYNNINEAIKTGDKAKLRRIIAKENNPEIKNSLQRMLKYL